MKKTDRKLIRKVSAGSYVGRDDSLAQRERFAQSIRRNAEHGKVLLVESGRDCDGVQYSGKTVFLRAVPFVVERYIEHCLDWSDGPMHFEVTRPSVRDSIRYHTRDLTLEAFEHGHAHCLYV